LTRSDCLSTAPEDLRLKLKFGSSFRSHERLLRLVKLCHLAQSMGSRSRLRELPLSLWITVLRHLSNEHAIFPFLTQCGKTLSTAAKAALYESSRS
jgi:hypothetical protein